VHRDSFALPASAAAELANRQEVGREYAVLTIRAQGETRPYATPARTATIEALVNLHNQPRAAETQP
jgi:hypothetical protein